MKAVGKNLAAPLHELERRRPAGFGRINLNSEMAVSKMVDDSGLRCP
jgi:hypothetical protein